MIRQKIRNVFTGFGDSRGDTIVEVLIAIGVVSLVLTSAYALTNKNVRSIQEVQERGYAQKLVEQQIELLRAVDPKPTTSGCFRPADGALLAAGNSVCRPTVSSVSYTLLVSPQTSPAGTYRVQATWDKLGGGQSKVTVYYRVEQ
ncbi:hypothetical protein CSA80_04285 [Candidatus Saccharibacteria bacterium]|nr:MAG: hypothetical protein CR973_01640 [Candidatus Saccharibacteria bacterium]PID98888.1 MAG: hypothetical protein CSA80_04285 [Candidatus Saccharibacteria bacterium]